MTYITIEQLVERLHVDIGLLRHLEEEGLIAPELGDGGTLLYSECQADRVRVATDLVELGVNDAGLEIILGMRERLIDLREGTGELLREVREMLDESGTADREQTPKSITVIVLPE